MTRLKLSNTTKVALIDDEDYERCKYYTWFMMVGSTGSLSIRSRVGDKNSVLLARFVLNDFISENIDHKDRNSFNNQKENLRPASYKQNAQNRKPQKSNTTGYKGVSKRPRSRVDSTIVYAATIRLNGKNRHLGIYDTPEQAAARYNRAALRYFGEFAYLNILPEVKSDGSN